MESFQLNLELPPDTTLPVIILAPQHIGDTILLTVENGRIDFPATIFLTPTTTTEEGADQDNDGIPDSEDRCPTMPQGRSGSQGCPTSITDTRDNQIYPLVIIEEQVWLGKNLNFATDSSWCYLELPQACQRAGRLYTWEVAKRACPEGWHLPTDEEWQKLATTAGGYYDFSESKEVGDRNLGYKKLLDGGELNFGALLGGIPLVPVVPF